MPINKARKRFGKATLAGVKKEMAKPRVAKSARKEYANLDSPGLLAKLGKRPVRKQVKSNFASEL
jgi:hypothetical protein